MIGAMLETIWAWSLLFVLLVGFAGCFMPKIWLEKEAQPWVLLSVSGYLLLIGVLQLWHLLFPVNVWSFYGLSFFSAWGLWRLRFELRSMLQRCSWGHIACLIVVLIWLSNRAQSPRFTFDTGLYHLQMVNWLKAYAIVPGLGNLKGSLSFNNPSLLYAAWVDQGPWTLSTVRFSTGLLIAIFLSSSLQASVIRKGSMAVYNRAYFALMLLPILFCAVYSIGLSTDIPLILLGVFFTERFFRIYFSKDESLSVVWIPWILAALACLIIKLSACVFVLVLLLMGIYPLLKNGIPYKKVLGIAVLGLSFWVLPWVIRGYILSGYPGFPSAFGAIDVEWRVPEYILESERIGIETFAKNPSVNRDLVGNNWDWLVFWVPNILAKDKGIWMVLIPLVGSLVMFALLIYLGRGLVTLGYLLPMFAGLTFWFLMAPAPRFLGVTCWYAFIGLMVYWFSLQEFTQKRWFRLSTYLNILAGCLVLGAVWVMKPESIWTTPGPINGVWPLPEPTFEEKRTKHGLVVLRPTAGGGEMAQVWNMPLVSGFTIDPNLRLRGKRLSDGFMIEE